VPRSKEQNEEIRRQRREAILRSALKVYADKGYAAAEIGDVAEQAGIARGLVYYYYKDKLSLFRELFLFMFEQAKRSVRDYFSREGTVSGLMESFINGMYFRMMEQSEYVVFFTRMRHDVHVLFQPDELKEINWHVEYLQVISATLEKGMAAGEIRQMNPQLLVSQFWGAVMHGIIHSHQRMLELGQEGRTKEEITAIIGADLKDAVAVCMAIVRPSPSI
jgi:TetR/AcrR family transcriptional regulator